tara:strand:- start:179 stop:784 length:606 start_codon:yes stop_codon:yes gene_type:complete
MRRASQQEIEQLLETLPVDEKNTKFAKGAHNLWVRFHNYSKHDPFVLEADGQIVAVCHITVLKNKDYANLYEIYTIPNSEGKGYASTLYWQIMEHMANSYSGIRLKMSCTPSSIGWHYRNGIIGYGVDPSGSIRVDMPIEPTKEMQLALREGWKTNPEYVLPPAKSREKLLKENPTFGVKKSAQVEQSIGTMGEYYLREYL